MLAGPGARRPWDSRQDAGATVYATLKLRKAASMDAAFNFLAGKPERLPGAEGVADGRADAEHVVGVELDIVMDVVVVNLGANENLSPDIVANTAAKMFHEVIAAGVVDATGSVARGGQVESVAGDADAGEKVQAKLIAQAWLEERIHVREDRAKLLITGIVRLMDSKSGFNIQAKAFVAKAHEVSADIHVGAALFRWWLEVQDSNGRSRGHKRAAPAAKSNCWPEDKVENSRSEQADASSANFFNKDPLSG